jgi:phage terminase large subunit-like protein
LGLEQVPIIVITRLSEAEKRALSLRYYDRLPEQTYGAQILQSWDTAAKNGAQNVWSVCTTWMLIKGYYYLIDVTRGRYDYPTLRGTAFALAQRYRPQYVLIEDASTGTALAQDSNRSHSVEWSSSLPLSMTRSVASTLIRANSLVVWCFSPNRGFLAGT